MRRIKSIRRIKPRLMGVAAACLVLGAYAYLGVAYLQQQSQRDSLLSQIEVARQLVSVEPGRLAERLADAHRALAQARAAFPGGESIGVVDKVLDLASRSEVEVTDIGTEPPRPEQVGEHVYTVLEFSVAATGRRDSLLNFVDRLEQDMAGTLVLDVVRIREGQETHTARLDFSIYAQPTAPE